jgi:hypothetical protein
VRHRFTSPPKKGMRPSRNSSLLCDVTSILRRRIPLREAAYGGYGDVTTKLIDVHCNVDLQDEMGYTPLNIGAGSGHESVAKQLLARSNIDLRTVETEDDLTALQLVHQQGHAGIATLIRNTRRQREKEERRRKEEENRQKEEVERRQKEIRRQREEETRLWKEEEDRRKEEEDFCRVWRGPIELLEKAKGNERKSGFGLRRPWMQEIKETLFDFSKMEEDAESLAEVLVAQQLVLSTDFPASQDNVVPPDGGGGGALEGDAACEVDVEGNMELESVVVEDSLTGDMLEEQWLCANSDNESHNWTIWYTDEVRKWYKHAVRKWYKHTVSSLKSH